VSQPRSSATIFVVSDGRGDTGLQVVRAGLVQFKARRPRIESRPFVRSVAEVEEIVHQAASLEAVVFYTLVADDTRRAMKESSEAELVPAVDLLGPAFSALHDLFESAPDAVPGLLYESDREHFDRIDAIDYTLKHDDGQRPHELHLADVVLVGVSRASKSSTCFYLAYEGIRAANVPLVPRLAPPAELLALDPRRVIGLRINTMRLKSVREARVLSLGDASLDDYVDKRTMAQEIRYANELMARHDWRTIDVSYLAIEEVAKEVLGIIRPVRRR
jgi:regulator of PEP synthase PpsR (kinase-PPPase family)